MDMGAGSAAVLGLYAFKLGCEVVATELDDAVADQAEEAIAMNGAAIELRRGAFFAGHAGALDIVLFNPPYVPADVGRSRGLPLDLRAQWDGGPEGTTVIAGLLDAVALREDAPCVLMGVNRRHVPREKIEALFHDHGELELETVEPSPLGVDVYVFSTKKSPIASASSPQA